MDDQERIRWAPKVSPAKIQRLYENDARGIVDEELVDEVGMALFARCHSVLLVSAAQVECPRCGLAFTVSWNHREEDVVPCPAPGCGWRTTYGRYHASWHRRDLIGNNAAGAFRAFVDAYGRAATARERMLLIDRVIHAFHQAVTAAAGHRSAANNLIEGNHEQVVALLDRLAYGEGSAPETRATAAEWRRKVPTLYAMRRPKRIEEE